MAKKKEYVTYHTAVGTLEGMVALDKAVEYKGDGNFKYFTNFLLDPNNDIQDEKYLGASGLILLADAEIAKIQEESGDERIIGTPYIDHEDYDTKEKTGSINFKFSVRTGIEITRGKRKGEIWDRRPTFVDAKGNVLQGVYPKLAAGSRVAIAFQTYAWHKENRKDGGVGVMLQPTHIQLIEVVEYTGGGGGNGGFGASSEEGGYVAPPAETNGGLGFDPDGQIDGGPGAPPRAPRTGRF